MNKELLTDPMWDNWQATLNKTYNISMPKEALEKFKIYLQELIKWNENINLISYRTEKELLWRHFTDSLMSINLIDKYAVNPSIIDLGTGAGFPGFILKTARPDYDITLVESQKKKCDFLEHLKNALGYPELKIINERAEALGQDSNYREKFDLAVSRAMCKLAPNLENAVPLVKQSGHILIYKTEESACDIVNDAHIKKVLDILNSKIIETFNYTICELAQNFSIIVLKKELPTPGKYPRRPGMPEKRPL
ncbi:MAG: 16S rRNA (guanine(527)-N(7))-methyltransferase RsmG [Elusimicrobia bacterium]|nr:16S rRNA (guanine(527)-N(7))-methyltransferase RsmG [Candidatus Liberimonas magnetica]